MNGWDHSQLERLITMPGRAHELPQTGSTPGKIISINHHTGRCLLNFQLFPWAQAQSSGSM